MKRSATLASFLLVGLGCLSAARADVHPNTQGGFPPEQAFSVGEIDNVNLFNGALVLTIPIGQSYPVSSHFSYRLSLVYNHNAWEFTTYSPGPGHSDVTKGMPNSCSNAGLGWRLSLGSLNPSCVSTQLSVAGKGTFIYVGPDGAEHIFYRTLHEADPDDPGDTLESQSVQYTRDGSYLRLRKLTPKIAEIDFPDGSIHHFEGGRLTWMRDPFGNQVSVLYVPEAFAPYRPPMWVISDSRGRTQTVTFRTDLPNMAEAVSEVKLEGFGLQTATYTFSYEVHTLGRGCPNTDDGAGGTTPVALLVSVGLPDGAAYRMPISDYITTLPVGNPPRCTDNSGSLLGLILPTLGRLEWSYQTYRFPNDSSQQGWRTQKPGVATRTMRNPGGAVLGTWIYNTETIPALVPYRALKNTVINPLGQRTERYFSVSTAPSYTGWSRYDYALPFTRDTTHGGLFLSSRTFEAGGTPLRSEYVRYERDQVGSSESPDSQNSNRRLQASRTVFDDDPGIWADTAFYEFDGLGHYRNQQTSGTFPGSNSRARYVAFNPAQGIYSVDPASNTTAPGFTMKPASQPWVLGAPAYDWDSENGTYSWRDYCYQPGTQVEKRRRTHRLDGAAQSSSDLVMEATLSAAGDVTEERHYGGDAQMGIASGDLCTMALPAVPEYQVNHTYSNGVLATSEYAGMGFRVLDRTIDRTGLPSASRDAAGIFTNYEYDALGRLTWSKPEAGHGGWTQYVYGAADPFTQTRAGVVIRRRGNGSPSASILQTSQLTFDYFGRVFREQQSLPGGSFNLRETLYDPAGNKESVSEVQSGSVNRRTYFFNYDPFGRPRSIQPPDGIGHNVTLGYQGTRRVQRTVKVASGAGGAEESSTTTEIYDRHGRLYQVLEPSGAGGATTTTTYGYEVNGRLSQVTMTDGSTTQSRSFTYDRAGLLSAETHPEKGTSGNGTVSYPRYDSMGNVLRKIDGASDLTYFYDAAERLYRVRETGGAQRTLKTFTYAGGNGFNDWRKGKLQQQSRFNYTSINATPFTVELRETYTYGGRDGRVSARKLENFVNGAATPNESFDFTGLTYDPLGNLEQLNYPSCLHAGCPPAPRTVANGYTEGLLTSVGMPGLPGYYASSITYHPNLQVSQVVHGNGLTDTQANDPNSMLRPGAITVTAPGGATRWSTGTYTYDGAGNIRSMGSHTFTYDKVSRLKSASLYLDPINPAGAVSQSFTYDAFGNLQSIAGNAGRNTPTSSSTNRLSAAGTTYDAAGNLTLWAGNVYEYDPLHMMSRYKTPTDEWIYLYTADDERAWSYKVGGTESRWTLRGLGNQVLREYQRTPSSPNWEITDSIYRGASLLAGETPQGLRHYHLDHLGTPRLISNNLGQQAGYHVYYPYGEEATAFNQGTIRTKFTGHERDLGNLGGVGDDLDYMHARFASPLTGRLLSVDPILQASRAQAKPQLWNRYAYALCNPLSYIDPTGAVVNLASMSAEERQQLMNQLAAATGLMLGYDESGGTLQILGLVKSASGASVGSALARADLTEAVGSDKTFYGISRNGSSAVNMGERRGPHLYLDFADIAKIDTGKNPSETFNAGIIFLHELKHAQGLRDPVSGMLKRMPDLKGETVEHMNRIRKELGLPSRQQYMTIKGDDGRFFIPFAQGPVYVPSRLDR